MEIQKQFFRRGRDFNRSGANISPELIGIYELRGSIPNELASNIVSRQDERITTVFHFVVDGYGNVIQSVPLNEKAKSMPTYYMHDLISILVVPSKIDGSLSEEQYQSLVDLVKFIKNECNLSEIKELNMRCFDDPENYEIFLNDVLNECH